MIKIEKQRREVLGASPSINSSVNTQIDFCVRDGGVDAMDRVSTPTNSLWARRSSEIV